MKFKKLFRRISILKYPVVIVIGIWGSIPALQPGVSGLKSQGDFLFGDDTIKRIELNRLDLNSHIAPSWCLQQTYAGRDKDIHFATCGFGSMKQKQIKEMYWDGVWNGPATIYRVGEVVENQDFLEMFGANINRDWEWLEFFYGYGPTSRFGAAFLGLAYVHMNAVFLAAITFVLFITFDAFVLAFMLCKFLINKIRQ